MYSPILVHVVVFLAASFLARLLPRFRLLFTAVVLISFLSLFLLLTFCVSSLSVSLLIMLLLSLSLFQTMRSDECFAVIIEYEKRPMRYAIDDTFKTPKSPSTWL